MNISGIRPSFGFYDNSINNIPDVKPLAEAPKQVTEQPKEVVSEQEISQARSKQTFGAYDYASQYNPSVTYSGKGETSDLNSLDLTKAVGNAAKDSLLQQYQYFVGDRSAAIADSKVAAAREPENFTL